MAKVPVRTPSITVRVYPLIQDAVERGILYGLRRAYKHDGSPKTEDELVDRTDDLLQSVMNELCELLDFGDD